MHVIKVISSIIVPFIFVFASTFLSQGITEAKVKTENDKKGIFHSIEAGRVDRVEVLKLFLEQYNSPLTENAETFVAVADRYGLDYRLLPAISCIESVCGKRLIKESYNAWGWGIYGNNVISFENFEQGIEKVGEGIYKGYVQKGLDTPEKMAPVYTPPRPHVWLGGINKFMGQMNEISKQLAVSSV